MTTHLAQIASGLTVTEVAATFHKSAKTIYRWHESGRLEGYRVGRTLRFPLAAVEALAQRMSTNEEGEARAA